MKRMNETACWQLIESGWEIYSSLDKTRKRAISLNESDALQQLAIVLDQVVVPALGLQLLGLTENQLTDFNHWIEEKMYCLDRAELFQHLGTSERCFIEARAFVIGMGQQYYEMIERSASQASRHTEVSYLAELGYKVYEEKYSRPFERFARHDMRTRSNWKAWARGANGGV